ncbi:hypothetical protein [Endomicrobium proavitum]|uniref:Uncharacterized protein n=1 Tax=Endomicrobium proavitum TaxID=1408281 RepID=A0A0G3WMC7_9BACT|nr:hypothetical protein [Endomicrobium proavitum]AKL98639.1 membrane protein of unknown function [Endomicrobium proavitum]
MAKAAFKISEVFAAGWKNYTNNPTIIGIFLISHIALFIFSALLFKILSLAFGIVGIILGIIILFFTYFYFEYSKIKASVIAAQGKKITLNVLDNDIVHVGKFIIVSVILLFITCIVISIIGTFCVVITRTYGFEEILVAIFLIPIGIILFSILFPALFMAADKRIHLNAIKITTETIKITFSNFREYLLYTLNVFLILILLVIIITIGISLFSFAHKALSHVWGAICVLLLDFMIVPVLLFTTAEAYNRLFKIYK